MSQLEMNTPPFNAAEDLSHSRSRSIAGLLSRPSVQIKLKNHDGNHAKTYSTMDQIEGTVTVTAQSDTRFDELEIAFIGTSRTFVDRMATTAAISGRTEATKTFLKLTQPIPNSAYPQPRVLKAGQTYRFPFTFNVPTQLLPRSCGHRCDSRAVRDAHLQLPPSLGDKELNATSGVPADDLAPDMSKITYSIRAVFVRIRDSDSRETIVAEKSKKVRVVPAAEEEPPVSLEVNLQEYRFREEKTIKKNLFTGKLGRLVMESVQPKSLHLPNPNNSGDHRVTTLATIMLRFDPAGGSCHLPRLSSLTTKLKCWTHYSSAVRHSYPTKAQIMTDMTQGVHCDTIPLSSRNVETVEWTKYTAPASRRTSTNWTPAPSSAYNPSGPFYIASILVPIDLPNNKSFVPSFYSCLVSRTYVLDISLSVHMAGPSSANLSLKLPVQVSCAENPSTAERPMSVSEAAASAIEAAEDVDAVFRPRSVVPTGPMYLGGSANMADMGEPPSYEVFPQHGGMRVSVIG
ncbi:MAG: hypothetical protein M1822_009606 [Bathelium mastoideum]|nr:MAG: hypothetical protein M1822_009606 [Bathelium mastoideum]